MKKSKIQTYYFYTKNNFNWVYTNFKQVVGMTILYNRTRSYYESGFGLIFLILFNTIRVIKNLLFTVNYLLLKVLQESS
jgi:hypothetical protein